MDARKRQKTTSWFAFLSRCGQFSSKPRGRQEGFDVAYLRSLASLFFPGLTGTQTEVTLGAMRLSVNPRPFGFWLAVPHRAAVRRPSRSSRGSVLGWALVDLGLRRPRFAWAPGPRLWCGVPVGGLVGGGPAPLQPQRRWWNEIQAPSSQNRYADGSARHRRSVPRWTPRSGADDFASRTKGVAETEMLGGSVRGATGWGGFENAKNPSLTLLDVALSGMPLDGSVGGATGWGAWGTRRVPRLRS